MPNATDTTSADLSDTDATTSLYRAAIGPVGTAYYLSVFNRFEAADRAGPSWNWAAALLTLNWMAYRQLWNAALVYAGIVTALPLLVFGLGRLVLKWPEEVELGALLTIVSALIALPGLYGNALYHAHCRKRMASALAAKPTLDESCALLLSRASSRPRMVWLAVANVAVLGVALFAYVQSQGFVLPAKDTGAGARQVAVGRTTELSPDAAAPPAAVGATPSPTTPTANEPQDAAKPTAPEAPVPAASLPTPGLAATNTVAGNRTSPSNEVVAGPAAASPTTSGPTATASPSSTAPPNPSAAPLPNPVTGAPGIASTGAGPKPAEPKARTAEPAPPSENKASKAAAALAAIEAQQPKATKPPAKTAEPKSSAIAKPATQPKEPPAKATTPKSQTAKRNAQPADPRYYINVGLFADDNNARNAYVKLMDAGLPAFKQAFNTSKGKRTRVRVGPFETEVQAEINAKRIQTLGLEAQVFESPSVIDTSGN